MNRAFLLSVAAFAAIVGFALVGDGNSANAGHHRKGCSGCSCSADSCAASHGCSVSACCSTDDCCSGRQGLLARLKEKIAAHKAKKCCDDSCHAAPSCCCAPAPCCGTTVVGCATSGGCAHSGGCATSAPVIMESAPAAAPAPAPAEKKVEAKAPSASNAGFGFRAVSFRR